MLATESGNLFRSVTDFLEHFIGMFSQSRCWLDYRFVGGEFRRTTDGQELATSRLVHFHDGTGSRTVK